MQQFFQTTHQAVVGKKEPDRLFRMTVLFLTGLSLLNFLLLIVLASGLRMVATRPLPNFVQMSDGKTIDVRPVDPLFRDSETIKDFVSQTSYLLFSWSNRIAVEENGSKTIKTDEGVSVNENQRVTTSTWEASFALSEDFRLEFLKGLADLMPPEVWRGKAYVSVKFIDISEPVLISPGRWEVKQVANLIVQDAKTPAGRAIPFNKTILVRAIDNPPLPVVEQATYLQKTIYRIRSARMEIYEIRDLETGN